MKPPPRRIFAAAVCLNLLWVTPQVAGQMQQFVSVARINRKIQGRVVEFTRNHGSDNRLYSPILNQWRDVYFYLPPNYSPCRQYPLVLYIHGAFGDEHGVLTTGQFEHLDRLICCGACPPLVMVCPDSTCKGRNFVLAPHSFMVNGCCGCFEDHVMREVIPWTTSRYSIRCDRDQHAVVGVSAGGLAAMRLALKYRSFFGSVASVSGALDLRYQTCCGDYFADFDPRTYQPRTQWEPKAIVGKLGPLKIKAKLFIEPVFGAEPGMIQRIVCANPTDMLRQVELAPGELNMLITYGKQDNFNFDAHAESFVHTARCQNLSPAVFCDPEGTHRAETFEKAMRQVHHWLGESTNLAQANPSVERSATLGSAVTR